MKIHIDDKKNEPWWVIVLKIVAYAIGLILTGIGTGTAAAAIIG